MNKHYFFVIAGLGVLAIASALFMLYVSYAQQRYQKGAHMGFVEWLKTDRRITQQTISTPSPQPTFDPSSEMGTEQYNVQMIKRGEYQSYDVERKILTIRDDFSPSKTSLFVNLQNIENIYCWPEVVENPNGTKTLLREAFIPFTPNRALSWPTQAIKPWTNVSKTIGNGSYFILKLLGPATGSEKRNDRPLLAEQLVLLGC